MLLSDGCSTTTHHLLELSRLQTKQNTLPSGVNKQQASVELDIPSFTMFTDDLWLHASTVIYKIYAHQRFPRSDFEGIAHKTLYCTRSFVMPSQCSSLYMPAHALKYPDKNCLNCL